MMKKIVSAFLAGALMMVSVQAFGDSISQIGKKIQTEYTVTVDGQQLSVPAIAVDGKSYAPVRAIGEAAGYDISVTEKSITLTTKENVPVADIAPTPEVVSSPTSTPAPEKSKTDVIKEKAVTLQVELSKQSNEAMKVYMKLLNDRNNTDLKLQYDQYDKKIKELQGELKQLESQLAELQQK